MAVWRAAAWFGSNNRIESGNANIAWTVWQWRPGARTGVVLAKRNSATCLEDFLDSNSRVQKHRKKYAHIIEVVEGNIAGDAVENEVFERSEIGQLGDTTAMKLTQLKGEVSLYAVSEALENVRGGNDSYTMLPVQTA